MTCLSRFTPFTRLTSLAVCLKMYIYLAQFPSHGLEINQGSSLSPPISTDIDQNPLMPITNNSLDPTILNWIRRIGPSPTGSSLVELIQETLSLNWKQHLVIQIVLSHMIKYQKKFTVEVQDQMLLYITGEGSVGKTQVIKVISLGYELLE